MIPVMPVVMYKNIDLPDFPNFIFLLYILYIV